jgi:xanthine dehydrogenase accessory factor
LVIVGAGHVGEKVAELAADVGFDLTIVDDRQEYCNADRFPQAQDLVVGEFAEALPKLKIDQNTLCLIVTRGHNHDEEALYHLAQTEASYVGLIGSKRKIKLIFEDLLQQGISPEKLERVYAPIGFDIGSQTVPEIAISMVAELIAHRNLGGIPEQYRARNPLSELPQT